MGMPDFAARRTIMVDTQIRPSDVTKFPIIEAFLNVPRERFVPAGREEAAYVGGNLDLGGGRVMLEPRTLAKMLDAADLGPEDLVLILGAGLGYTAAVVGHIVQAVVAVESDEMLAQDAETALTEQEIFNVALLRGPLAEGAADHGPYDTILIEGAVETVTDAVLSQLKDGGRIIAIFADGALGVVRIGYKLVDNVTWRFAFNAGAPLLEEFTQSEGFVL